MSSRKESGSVAVDTCCDDRIDHFPVDRSTELWVIYENLWENHQTVSNLHDKTQPY